MEQLGPVGALPICGDDDRLGGMLTDRDIVIRGLAGRLGSGHHNRPASSPKATSTTSTVDADIRGMLNVMEERQGPAPARDRQTSRLVGIVSEADMARHLPEHAVVQFVKAILLRKFRPSQVTKSVPKAADHVPCRVRHRSDLGVHERYRLWGGPRV